MDDPDAPSRPPIYPSRVQAFVYGCAMAAEHFEVEHLKASAGRGM
jgi:hypothetical protein